jgi:hypothetical protein
VFAARDAVGIEKAYVEPDRGIERANLVDAKPDKLVIEDFRVGVGCEVAVALASVRNRPADAVDELFDGVFSLACRNVTVEVLAGDDLGCQLAPAYGDFKVILLEDDLAGVAGNLCGAGFPLKLVEGVGARCGKTLFNLQAAMMLGRTRNGCPLCLGGFEWVLRAECLGHFNASMRKTSYTTDSKGGQNNTIYSVMPVKNNIGKLTRFREGVKGKLTIFSSIFYALFISLYYFTIYGAKIFFK